MTWGLVIQAPATVPTLVGYAQKVMRSKCLTYFAFLAETRQTSSGYAANTATALDVWYRLPGKTDSAALAFKLFLNNEEPNVKLQVDIGPKEYARKLYDWAVHYHPVAAAVASFCSTAADFQAADTVPFAQEVEAVTHMTWKRILREEDGSAGQWLCWKRETRADEEARNNVSYCSRIVNVNPLARLQSTPLNTTNSLSPPPSWQARCEYGAGSTQ